MSLACALLLVVTARHGVASAQESRALTCEVLASPRPVACSPEVLAEAAAVIALEEAIGRAIVAGDGKYVDSVTAPDFVMTHGDGWTRGAEPALVDDEAGFLKRVTDRLYAVHDYEKDTRRVEMHGSLALTYGRYIGHIPSSRPGRAWFSVWYVKVYAKRDGRWIYLSHRTVRGAHYGLDRDAVRSK